MEYMLDLFLIAVPTARASALRACAMVKGKE